MPMATENLLVLMVRRRLKGVSGLPIGIFRIDAGGAVALLRVAPDGAVEVRTDDGGRVDAWVKGGLRTLLGVLVGEVHPVRAALTGRVAFGGKWWKLPGLLRRMTRR